MSLPSAVKSMQMQPSLAAVRTRSAILPVFCDASVSGSSFNPSVALLMSPRHRSGDKASQAVTCGGVSWPFPHKE